MLFNRRSIVSSAIASVALLFYRRGEATQDDSDRMMAPVLNHSIFVLHGVRRKNLPKLRAAILENDSIFLSMWQEKEMSMNPYLPPDPHGECQIWVCFIVLGQCPSIVRDSVVELSMFWKKESILVTRDMPPAIANASRSLLNREFKGNRFAIHRKNGFYTSFPFIFDELSDVPNCRYSIDPVFVPRTSLVTFIDERPSRVWLEHRHEHLDLQPSFKAGKGE